jgi:chorismate mutase
VAGLAVALGAGAAAAHGGFGGGHGLGSSGGLKAAAGALTAKKAFEADVAKRLGTTVAKLNAAIATAAKAQIDAAVEDDELTAAEADALKEAIDEGTVRLHGAGRASVVAKALGVTTAKLNEAYREARRAQALARVAQALEDGDLDAEEAAELRERIEDADFPGYAGGKRFGPGGHRGFGGFAGPGRP